MDNEFKISLYKNLKKIILNIVVVMLAFVITRTSCVPMAKLWFAMVIVVSVICYIPWIRIKKVLFAIITVVLCIVLGKYYIENQKYIEVLGVTYSYINTQSYYFNGSDRNHRDVVIYTLMKDKVAVIPSETEWYGEYISIFSKNVVVDEKIQSETFINNVELYQVGNMAIKVYSDLFDEITYNELCERKDFPQLYVVTSNWENTDTIAVVGDEEQNLYLIPYKQ